MSIRRVKGVGGSPSPSPTPPTVPASQIAYGSSTNSITTNGDFTFNSGVFLVGFSGDNYLSITNDISSIGDNVGVNNSSAFSINDSLNSAYYESKVGGVSLDKLMTLDGVNHLYEIGSQSGIGNGLYANLQASTSLQFIIGNSVLSSTYFSLDTVANTYQLGDLTGSNQYTYIDVDDNTSKLIVQANYLVIQNNLVNSGFLGIGEYDSSSAAVRMGYYDVTNSFEIQSNYDGLVGSSIKWQPSLRVLDLNVYFGDIENFNSHTAIDINDTSNYVSVNGNRNVNSSKVVFTGIGTSEMNLLPTAYLGFGGYSYTVTISHFLNTITISSVSGVFSVGDTIVGNATGATGILIAEKITNSVFLFLTTSGSFVGETSIVDMSSGATGAVVVGTAETGYLYDWSDSSGNGDVNILVTTTVQNLSNGVEIQFTEDTFGQFVGNTYSWYYTVYYGRMLLLDGQAKSYSMGDVDAVNGGTIFKINDTSISTFDAVIQDTSGTYLSIDNGAQTYLFGDVSQVSSGNLVEINDSSTTSILGSLSSPVQVLVDDGNKAVAYISSIATPTMQVFSPTIPSSAVVISDGVRGIYIDPATPKQTCNIQLPANPVDGQEIEIFFGGTITSGNVMTVAVNILANTGQQIIGSTLTTGSTEDYAVMKYRAAMLAWYTIDGSYL